MSDSKYTACRVDFTPKFEVSASTDTQRSINPTYLQKVILQSTGLGGTGRK